MRQLRRHGTWFSTVMMSAACALTASACTGPAASGEHQSSHDGAEAVAIADESLVTIPPVGASNGAEAEPTKAPSKDARSAAVNGDDGDGSRDASSLAAESVAVIDSDAQLGLVDSGGAVSDEWFTWDAFPAPDRSVAVLTLGPDIGGIGPERPVTWVSLPDGEALAEQSMSSSQELTATSLDGTFAGFTSQAEPVAEDAIAGVRRSSTIEIISRDGGLVFSRELLGNFVPEAFSRRVVNDVPALVFLLEYFPADAPKFYRVRVLSTSTGEVSLPLNLRDKAQQVDERMAGFSRSQVVAHEHGLLFTLYRGTVDGTPDGEPYAFVHTLDFADGVWCLDVDPRLELDRLDGSLAVGGDRLYVASANGSIGSFRIPSISDPDLSPTMEWVVEAGPRHDRAPVMTADHEAVYVVDEQRPGMLARVSSGGDVLPPTIMSGTAEALAWKNGALHAVGEGWATFDLDGRPDWLDDITHLVIT